MARRVRVLERDLAGRAGRHPVVDLLGAVRDPPRRRLRELDTSDGGVVPQEPIAAAGDHERDRDLGVALNQVKDDPLLV